MSQKPNILVLGIGNPILSDDGIGAVVTEQLSMRSGFKNKMYFRSSVTGGLDLLGHICGFSTVVFIDACRTGQVPPGEVRIYGYDDYQETLHLSNPHDVTFKGAINMGRRLDLDMPEEVYVIAIEIEEDKTFSRQMTPALQHEYNQIMRKCTLFLTGLLKRKERNTKKRIKHEKI